MTNYTIDNTDAGVIKKAITWQFDNALMMRGFVECLAAFFKTSVEDFWNAWEKNVVSIDSANTFGLSIWGRLLACPRMRVVANGSWWLYTNPVYRKLLKARFLLLGKHATVSDYREYANAAFTLSSEYITIKDTNDMAMSVSATEPSSANTYESADAYLINNYPLIAFPHPSAVIDNTPASVGIFGFDGQQKVSDSDPLVQTMDYSQFYSGS